MQRPKKRLRTSRPLVFGKNVAHRGPQTRELEDVFRDNQHILPGLDRTFEALFDKYANMPEDAADVVDLETETLVVDNGHLRSLQQNPQTWERAQMLDGIVTGSGWDLEEDSKDELAPSRSPSPVAIRRTQVAVEPAPPVQALRQTDSSVEQASSEAAPTVNEAQFSDACRQLSVVQQPGSTSSVPPTSDGLLKIIQQFVDQSVAQRLLQQQVVSQPLAQQLSDGPMSTPVAHQSGPWRDPVPPATDPKWYFPPLPRLASTTPLAASTSVPRRRRVFPSPQRIRQPEPGKCKESPLFITAKSTRATLSSPIIRQTQKEDNQTASAAPRSSLPGGKALDDSGLEEQATSGNELRHPLRSHIREQPLSTPSLIYSDGTESHRDIGDSEANRLKHADPPVTIFDEDMDVFPMPNDNDNDAGIMQDLEKTHAEDIPLILPSIESDNPFDGLCRDPVQQSPRKHVQVVIPVRSRPKSQTQRAPVTYDSEEGLVPMDEVQKPEAKAAQPPIDDAELRDELDAPCTPAIKRESLTPGPCCLLRAVPPATPKSAPQQYKRDVGTTRDTPRATPKLSKLQLLRLARAQWAKQGRSGTPQTSRHRKSLPSQQKKRWVDDSEDELA
ncbi:uncharacterized protein EI97DRAFT_465492 [Westerdykella ornata]|uniref:Uncharacterized protein n=1 Tax=Westerdykella ornata TaxID=318751 RepID=A0A6A6JPC5_WESOR|nr:uncharacterized protein EI97DRAFT_465492 [Westerdykella ornata]KAF2278114.1 hypothetical protein EI97DRAFT_465492 [Westerdykella ornata]